MLVLMRISYVSVQVPPLSCVEHSLAIFNNDSVLTEEALQGLLVLLLRLAQHSVLALG
jgi:hypothetical protein